VNRPAVGAEFKGAAFREPRSRARIMALCACLAALPGTVRAALPEELFTPGRRVVCNTPRGVCYDRMGSSIGLTQIFLDREAAQALTAASRAAPPGVDASFSPAPGVVCVRETGPCREHGAVHEELGAVLFGF
jgi:hypothetical protein